MLTWEAAKRLIRGIDLTRYVLRDFPDQINALIFPIIYIMLSKNSGSNPCQSTIS